MRETSGINTTELIKFDGLVWTKVIGRKKNYCFHCAKDINKGQMVFKPLTNSNARWRRLCCIPTMAVKLI